MSNSGWGISEYQWIQKLGEYGSYIFHYLKDYYHQTESKTSGSAFLSNRLDPKVHENALKILNISEAQAQNEQLLEEKYKKILTLLQKKQGNVSPVFAESLTLLIRDVEVAYETEKERNFMAAHLRTPTEIYHALTPTFPFVTITKEQNNPLHVSINLDAGLPPIRVIHSINRDGLLLNVHQIAMSRIGNQQPAPELFDVSRFFIQESLTSWVEFSRLIHTSNGFSLRNEIVNYLDSPDQNPPQQLLDLELGPDQITENELPFFRELLENQEEYVDRIGAKYPQVMQQLRLEAAREEVENDQGPTEYDRIFRSLKNRVKGQQTALEIVAATLASQRAQNTQNYKFLFVGPTGIGKTELAKAVASHKNHMITFPMNQYPGEHNTTLFFGSPPSYLGSDSKPVLANELDACDPADRGKNGNKYIKIVKDTVILFDELEKAHMTIRQSLLSLFDEGTVDVSYTKRGEGNITIQYLLQNCVIICTSNLFQQEIVGAFQQGLTGEQIGTLFTTLNQRNPLQGNQGYSPEFLGRLRIVPFGPIPRGRVYQSLLKGKVRPFLAHLQAETSLREVEIEPGQEDDFYRLLERKVYGNGTNIRNVNNYLHGVKGIVFQNQNRLGDLSNKKLSFTCSEERILMKFSTYVYGDYVDTPIDPIEI